MKNVVILRGPSGAGKSTYIEKTFRGLNPKVCSADLFFVVPAQVASKPNLPVVRIDVRDDYVYDFDPTKLPEAHSDCMASFLGCILQEAPLIVLDNTNIRTFEYHNYMVLAKMHGYDVEIVEMVPETVDELKMVISRNRHRVPADVICKMVLNFEPAEAAIRVPVQ